MTHQDEDRFNRQLHPDEREWAKENSKEFAEFYAERAGREITEEQAQSMLLASGYRLVDSMASKGLSDELLPIEFIGQFAGSMFSATPTEYNNPFLHGNESGSLTPEQKALPGATPAINPDYTSAVGAGAGTKNWCGIIYQCSTGKLPSLSQFLLSAAPWQNSINEHTWPNIKKGVMAGAIMAFIWTLYLVPRRR